MNPIRLIKYDTIHYKNKAITIRFVLHPNTDKNLYIEIEKSENAKSFVPLTVLPISIIQVSDGGIHLGKQYRYRARIKDSDNDWICGNSVLITCTDTDVIE